MLASLQAHAGRLLYVQDNLVGCCCNPGPVECPAATAAAAAAAARAYSRVNATLAFVLLLLLLLCCLLYCWCDAVWRSLTCTPLQPQPDKLPGSSTTGQPLTVVPHDNNTAATEPTVGGRPVSAKVHTTVAAGI